MKTRHLIAVLAVAGTTTAAGAQFGATYSIAFGAPNGPNTIVLGLGQSTSVFVNITHSGSVPANPILGFANGGFSITGVSIGNGPAGTWSVDSNTASPTYSLPDPWGAQTVSGLGVSVGTPNGMNVDGVLWGYGFLLSTAHPSPQNPATVWQGTFTVTSGPSISLTLTGLEPTAVFLQTPPLPTPVWAMSLPGVGGTIIVPAPVGLALLGLGGMAALRRRRT